MRAGLGYESNITRTNDPLPDLVYMIEPRLKLGHATERLDARLEYRPEAEFFQFNGGANGVNQILNFRSSYQLSPRSEIFAENRFGYVRYLQQFDIANEPSEVDVSLARTTINRARASYRHSLTPRLDLSVGAHHNFRKSTRRSDPPVTTLIGSTDLNYLLTRSDHVGVGLAYTYSSIADNDSDNINLDARRSNSVDLFLSWARKWNRGWDTLLRLGPAWVSSTRTLTINGSINGMPVSLDQSFDSQNVTAFGHAQISRTWSKARLELNYQRSLSALSNVGSDSTLDAVYASLRWDPTPKWQVRSRAGWNRRASLAAEQSNSPVASLATAITQYYFSAGLIRKLSRKLGIDLEFRFRRQEAEGFLRNNNSFNNYQVNLSARYEFAPLRP